jgi:23S rRNA (cytosine1962-C5)-methyltransferase
MNKARVVLKKGKYDSLLRQHPWVFSGAIKDIFGNPQEGDIVDVVGAKEEYFGAGHFQHGSIAVRMLSFEKEKIDEDFFQKRIQQALQYRLDLGYGFDDDGIGNAWRLVYGEADRLPGLIIDYYNGVAVIQAHSIGFYRIVKEISNALQVVLKDKLIAVVNKSKDYLRTTTETQESQVLFGQIPLHLTIHENGNKFIIDVIHGQKTGFFLDQRENRKLVSLFAANKKVLNMFCYTGGFSIYALNGHASLVHSVDSSRNAIELTKQNIQLNGFDSDIHLCIAEDAFSFIESAENFDYDVVVLDPPAYAKHADARHRAVKGYQRLNNLAISKIKKGGFIFTFSCSQVVDKKLFESTVMAAALLTRRHVRVVQELTHAPCHAHSIAHPEGKYLKGLLLYVE